LLFDFNRNGRYDFDTGEPFEDPNGNGVYDLGDILLQDGNGNGTYDPERDLNLFANTEQGRDGNDDPEPFIDGDISLGEPFTDINRNGIYDGQGIIPGFPQGEPYEDLSHDGKYQSSADPWVEGVPFRDLNGNQIFDRGSTTPSGSWSSSDADYGIGEPFYDVNGNGRRDAAEGFYDRGWDGDAIWHERNPITTTLKVDLVSQMRREHELKVGATYSGYDLKFSEIEKPYVSLTSPGSYQLWQQLKRDGVSDEEIEFIFLEFVGDTLFAQSLDEPFPGRGSIRDFYRQKPSIGAFYIVDKMEYGQMVAQVGFRYEYFIQSDQAGSDAVFADSSGFRLVDYRDRFAPRIAFAYPISDKAKVFFNYGHFYQLPPLNQMYRRSTFSSSVTGTIGNVNLDFVKTIKYEFGLQYMLSSEYLLSIQGFYTDDFGRVSEAQQRGVTGAEATGFYENSDYSRARGLELGLDKKYGNYVSGSVTYDFSFAFGKSSVEALDYFENFYAQTGGSFRIQEFPLDWDERHAITFILDIRVPSDDHPRLFGLKLPDKWGLNIFWQYGSGFPYTPTRDHPGVSELLVGRLDPETNSQRLPAHNNVDIRFNKDFAVGPMSYTFEVWVNNLFDERAIDFVDAGTGRPESGNNFNTIIYAPDGLANPRRWAAGRQIRLGFGVNF
ncbi:MAG: TonB-dependent receptor, partial [Acidobacteria bacterium]|nr:TonB-dependent receptor [Acidobacteriota bacterium]